MNSYGDLDDKFNRGCLKPVLVIVLIAVLFLLFGCAGGPPTFKADVVRATDGKVVMKVNGSVDDNKPWLERYAGPLGAFLSGVGWIFMPAAPVATP